MESTYDALVIGAGHNGLIAACYLARAGRRVLVLERREIVGGACVTEDVWPGYRVSTAAYLCSLLRPEIVRELELEKYGFEVYRRETAGFAPFPGGRHLFLFAEEARTRQELEQFCSETPADVDAFFAFEAEIERVAAIIDPWLLHEPPTEAELKSAFAAAGAVHLYDAYITGSVRDLLDARFQNPALKAVLATDGLIGTYGGPSTPGTAYVLLHHYLGRILGAQGAWGYVRGGMGRITRALARSLEEHGGQIRTGAQVIRILRERGRAAGVALETGEEIFADAILSNADPYHTFEKLLTPELWTQQTGEEPHWKALKTQGGASAKINLAVSELPVFTCVSPHPTIEFTGMSPRHHSPLANHEPPAPRPEHLGTIHFCPDMEYLERGWEEARQGIPSTEPMIEMYLQTATDPGLAPQDRHILSLFVQYFPYNLAPGLDLDVEREKFADRVVEIIGGYAPNVPASILHRQVLTPRDLEARFGLTGGHIFHGDLMPPNVWARRPARGFWGAKTPLPGLYLCGSGAHPGGCVFGAPGYNAAQAVLASVK